jgi:hypothetical protein
MAALVAVLLALQWFTQANPAALARNLRQIAGVAVLGVAAILILRGLIVQPAVLAFIGAWLLGWLGAHRLSGGFGGRPTPGRTSRVVTDHLEMELDLDQGTMTGRVLKGMFEGREIESLKPVEMALLWQDCQFTDPQSAQILEAYLDRVHPTWREDMARGEREMASGPDGRMGPEEAYQILGLSPGASEDEIRKAHRELMLKLHPDRGGSTYLASKINEAKDVLLKE